MAALATCHRQAGDLDMSAQLFSRLYEINEALPPTVSLAFSALTCCPLFLSCFHSFSQPL